MYKIDLNCDMGESFGLYKMGNDEEMMQMISSANIAAGFHAGDPSIMRESVRLAKENGVAIGVHPGFPDLVGFGRRAMNATPTEVKDFVTYQMGALREFARAAGVDKLQHCKPHGALYMVALENREIARAILEAMVQVQEGMVVFTLKNSEVMLEANKMGIPVAVEAYSDREHTKDGSLVLTREGPIIDDYDVMAQRVVRMITEKKVKTIDGDDADIDAQTICIHGDTPGAPDLTRAIHKHFKEHNIQVVPVTELIAN